MKLKDALKWIERLLPVVKLIWSQLSPGLKEAVVAFVADLETKADHTEGKLDDWAVDVLKWLLSLTA